MQSNAEVTAADIARLAGVGRAAVSNWRKRFPDFPEPVGGTPTSPTFPLVAVEAWLRANDRLPTSTPLDDLLRVMRHTVAEVGPIDEAVRGVGEALLAASQSRTPTPSLPAELDRAIVTAIQDVSPAQVFEFLLERLLDAQGKQGAIATPQALAELMVRLVDVSGAVVLDPACGTGWLLHAAAAAGADRLLGQDINHDLVVLTEVRLGLAGVAHTVQQGSLRDDRFADAAVDVVVCDPPFGQRDWGFDELTFDSRWEYELPPRSEPELAWVQHALARLKPGGHAVVLLPPAVAFRPAGRRVRNALLRRGALRGIVALPPGAGVPAHLTLHLWLLRRPDRPGTPRDLLLVDASRSEWPGCAETITELVAAYQAKGEMPPEYSEIARAVPLLDLIDDEIDLTPVRHLGHDAGAVDAVALRVQRDELASVIATLPDLLAGLPDVPTAGSPVRSVAVADLIRDGQVTLHNAGEMIVREGDVLVQTVGARPRATVVTDASHPPAQDGPQTLLRPDPDRLDPWFLAGFVARATNVRLSSSLGTSRLDVRRARVPHLPLDRQREYGVWFERLDVFDHAVRQMSSLSTDVVHHIAEGLATGTLGG
ncbi:N-6 DNA methylase [Luedemannella flava]